MSSYTPAQVALASRAVDWLHANLHQFHPCRDSQEPEQAKYKAAVELSLLCAYVTRTPHFSDSIQIQNCLDQLSIVYNTSFLRGRFFRLSPAFLPHVSLAVYLKCAGVPIDDREWAAIQRLIDHSNALKTDRQPYQLLDLNHILELGQFRHDLPCPRKLFRYTMLSRQLNVIYLTDAEVYAITHIIFYLSDFGFRHIDIPDHDLRRVSALIDLLLGAYIFEKNWDLVAELLLCCHCLGNARSSFVSLGWEELINVQNIDGSVPGPSIVRGSTDRTASPSALDPNDAFKQSYHTTIAAALAGALYSESEGHQQ